MVTSNNPIIGRQLLLLTLLITLTGAISAHATTRTQFAPGDGEGQEQPAKTDGTILHEAPIAPASTNNNETSASGRWVPRVNAKTCPKGSTAYVDEKNGGLKCWVDDR